MRHRTGSLIIGALLAIALVGCGPRDPSQKIAAESDKPPSPDRVARLWSQSCALCHVTGVAGAPRAGDLEAWSPRLAKGKPMLLKHTIEGYNNMPPLGYCMACSKQDFSDLIDLMAGELSI